MADEILKSNIIIATKVTANRKGFRDIGDSLSSLEARLRKLTSTPYVIKIDIDSQHLKVIKGLENLGKEAGKASRKAKEASRPKAGIPVGPGAAGGISPTTPLPGKVSATTGPFGGSVTESKVRESAFKESGLPSSVKVSTVEESITGTIHTRLKITEELLGKKAGIESKTREEINLEEKAALNLKKKAIEQGKIVQLKEEEFNTNKKAADNVARALRSAKFTEDKTKRVEREVRLGPSGAAGAKHVVAVQRQFRKQLDETRDTVVTIDEATGRWTSKIKENTERAREFKRQQREAEKEAKKVADRLEKQRVAAARVAALQSQQGFKKLTPIFEEDLEGNATRVDRFFKSTRKGIASYEVILASVNEKTGVMTERTLRGAEAARFLGDSMFRASEKVLLWTAATSVVFGSIAAVRRLGQEISELESNTVFLARVGKNLASDIDNQSDAFEKQLEAANRLTSGIIDLTMVIGGSAAEAQRAAAIFLRAGQTEEQTLTSVKAALLAARIAELEVEEAAKLLQSALLQFNLEAKDLLPTLDTLNTLSNTYRVTTDDLLQAISRSGSVIAEHNGKLSELAAATAVVSQETARTGTQIGNAFKTIQSRLDRLEVRRDLFTKLGVSTVNFEGEAKSLVQTVQELQGRIEGLSSAEQKEIGIKIAGIRQLNIFNALIKNSDDVIIAQVQSLREESSAMKEFLDTSKTLESSIQRLSATFSDISNELRGPLGSTLKQISNLANILLSSLTAFDAVPLKFIALVGVFMALRFAVTLIGKAIAFATGNTINFNTSIFTSIQALNAYTTSLSRSIAMTHGLSNAMSVASAGAAAFIRSISSATAITAVITLLTFAISSAVDEEQRYQESLEGSIEKINKKISAEEKNIEAIKATTDALSELTLQQIRANKTGDIRSFDNLEERIQKLANALNVNLKGADTPIEKLARLQQVRFDSESDSIKRINKERERRIDLLKEELKVLAGEQVDLLNRRFNTIPEALTDIGNAALNSFGFGSEQNAEDRRRSQAKAIEEQRIEILNEIEKTKKEIALAADPDSLNITDRIREQSAQLSRLESLINLDEFFKLDDKISSDVESLLGFKSLEKSRKTFVDLNKETTRLSNSLNTIRELRKGIGEESLSEDQERLNEAVERSIKVYQKLFTTIRKSQVEAFSSDFERKASLEKRINLIRIERDAQKNNERSEITTIKKIDFQRNLAAARLISAQSKIESIRQSIQQSENVSPTLFAAAESAKIEAAESLNELRDLEIQKAESILESEKEIVEARKQSADEAARALGILSQEDKIRLLAQASFFSKNPNFKASVQDQFFADSDSVRIAQQFFGSKLSDSLDPTTKLGKLLSSAGFGKNKEIEDASKRIQELRGGRNDAQIAKEALERSREFNLNSLATRNPENIQAIKGLRNFNFAGNNILLDQNGKIAGPINFDLDKDIIDLTPIAEAFQDSISEIMGAEVERLEKKIRSIREISTRRPSTASR